MEILIIIVLALLYFIPSWIAAGKSQATSVFLLNLFLGWTVLGWLVALIWAANNDKPSTTTFIREHKSEPDHISALEKISKLRDSGVLS